MSGVSLKRSMQTAVLAATLASASLPHALLGQVGIPATKPIDLAADIRATLDREQAAVIAQTQVVVVDASPRTVAVPQAVRDEAALRLLSHHTVESRNILLRSAVNPGAACRRPGLEAGPRA